MPALHEIQRDFAAAVLGEGGVPPWIRPNGLPAERRLAVYRNSTLLGLAEALRDGFPVVHELVGAEFFGHLARSLVKALPPTSGSLLDYGGDFAGFIEGFERARELPYLPDVARLEWAWHQAFHAPDAPAWSFAELQALSPERYGILRFRLHPAVRLLESRWPLLGIFDLHRPDCPRDRVVDLRREGGCRVLIARPEWEVELHALTPGEFAFLAALGRDGDPVPAFEAARAIEPAFDLGAALLRGLQFGVFAPPVLPGSAA